VLRFATATGRRPVARISFVFDRPCECDRWNRVVTLTTDPTISSAAAAILPPEPGHCADAFLSAAFRYPTIRALAA
jgi:hypothetical protein